MRAMILAAGRGERMRPLTDHTPKPLLPVAGKPLLVWHLERLAAAGFRDIVINHAHLGAQIEATLGDGSQFGLRIQYSAEGPNGLETAGGIATALPLLNPNKDDAPFLVINGDIFCDWDVAQAPHLLADHDLAHLVLVSNPEHHPTGDFIAQDRRALTKAQTGETVPAHTFSGIGVYRPSLFAQTPRGTSAKLAPLLVTAMEQQRASAEIHTGRWTDVGTPQRLAELDAELRAITP